MQGEESLFSLVNQIDIMTVEQIDALSMKEKERVKQVKLRNSF